MGVITIYDDDGHILQKTDVPNGMELAQGSTGRNVYIGEADPALHKIIDGQRVDKTQEEIDTYTLSQQSMKRPFISGSETDEELNQKITDHFNGLINPAEYRVENYPWIREKFYPKLEEKADADVKINSGIPELVTIGQQQLSVYAQDCLNVKIKFPKE